MPALSHQTGTSERECSDRSATREVASKPSAQPSDWAQSWSYKPSSVTEKSTRTHDLSKSSKSKSLRSDLSSSTSERPAKPPKTRRSNNRNLYCLLGMALLILLVVVALAVTIRLIMKDEEYVGKKTAALQKRLKEEFGTDVRLGGDDPEVDVFPKGLELLAATLLVDGSLDSPRRMSMGFNDTLNRVAVGDGQEIPAGSHVLQIVYRGEIYNAMHGFYRSMYYNAEGEQRYIAISKFEPVDAREMMPCFDEPRFKANWTFTVRHPLGTTATSNMPLEGEMTTEHAKGLAWSRSNFKRSVKMSSYVTCMIVHDFAYITNKTRKNVQVGVYANRDLIEYGQRALDVAVRFVDYFEELTGVDYVLPKLDIFAIPDFAAGAMENWGIMTFRELVLYNPEVKNTGLWIDTVVPHEIVHQWFGNLVTMNWWGHLWLNEGFATFGEMLGARLAGHDDPHNTTGLRASAFLLESRVMDEDDTVPYKPIVYPENFDQRGPVYDKYPPAYDWMREYFDGMSYQKAGYGIYSMYETLGEKRFFQMIKAYLNKHRFSTTLSSDIWEEDPIKDDLWKNAVAANKDHLTLAGYPVIDVQQQKPGQFVVSTQRHRPMGVLLTAQEESEFWRIPITWTGSDEMIFMKEKDEKVIIPFANKSQKIPCVNPKGLAYARVNYGKLWPEVAKDFLNICPDAISRIFIYHDLFFLAENGLVDWSVALDFHRYLQEENNDQARDALMDQLSTVNNRQRKLLPESPGNCGLIKYAEGVFQTMYNNGEAANQANKRGLKSAHTLKAEAARSIRVHDEVIPKSATHSNCDTPNLVAVAVYHKKVMDICGQGQRTSQCAGWKYSTTRANAYCDAVRADNSSEIAEHIYEKLRIETDLLEQENLGRALLCSPDWYYVQLVLDALIERTGLVRLQSMYALMFTLSENYPQPHRLIGFLENNVERIYKRMHDSPAEMKKMFAGLMRGVRTKEDVEVVKKVRKMVPEHIGELPLWDQALERFHREQEWINKSAPRIMAYYDDLEANKTN
ncbi:unnamed protein product, partial [Mesorhabditis spiculigera]